MVAVLNSKKFTAGDLSAESYFADAGLVKDGITEHITREMAKRFPAASVDLPTGLPREGLVTYAYLEKTLIFSDPFDVLPDPLMFESSKGRMAVSAFGIRRPRNDTQGRRIPPIRCNSLIL